MHKIDYDLFVLDPENPDTRDHQYRDCLHDAVKTLNQRVENLESALKTQRLINQKLADAVDEITQLLNGEE